MTDYNNTETKHLSETALRVLRFQKNKNFWEGVLVVEGIFILIALWGLIKNIMTGKINGPYLGTIILWLFIFCALYLTYYMYKKNKNLYNLEVTPKIESDILNYQIETGKNKKKTYKNSEVKTNITDNVDLISSQNKALNSLTVGIFPSIKIIKMTDGTYTIGDDSSLSFQKYIWDGKRTKTTSKTITKGRKGKTIAGAAIGATINPAGAVVGGLVGANGRRKSTTRETEYEKSSKVTFIFKAKTGDTKSYSCNIKSDKIHDIEVFFS
ncbi:glycine zipper family protein [Lactococcus sp. bn62]|uniref:glycine zipper family protein n=1 Tax=Lactococcus sp. bn62 TaxID=3037457 RepID=UPI0024C4D8F1|nr:glycine zipper family protein [Lactococcus sp. bn62]WKY24538.1 glycine zipper family protein [Lactococcus sp. bn62]